MWEGVKFNKLFLTRGTYLIVTFGKKAFYVARAKTVEFPRFSSHIGKFRNHEFISLCLLITSMFHVVFPRVIFTVSAFR